MNIDSVLNPIAASPEQAKIMSELKASLHKLEGDRLWDVYHSASKALKDLSGGGTMGLTPDAMRVTDEWKAAKRAFDRAFAELRAHNSK